MTEAAITLPLSWVEDLLTACAMAEKQYPRGLLPWETVDDVRKEVRQVREMLERWQ